MLVDGHIYKGRIYMARFEAPSPVHTGWALSLFLGQSSRRKEANSGMTANGLAAEPMASPA